MLITYIISYNLSLLTILVLVVHAGPSHNLSLVSFFHLRIILVMEVPHDALFISVL